MPLEFSPTLGEVQERLANLYVCRDRGEAFAFFRPFPIFLW